MDYLMEYSGAAGFVVVGLLAGVVVGAVRTAYPDSALVRFLLAVAFVLPLSYLFVEQFRAGVAVLLGAAVGVVAYAIYVR